MSDKKEVLDYLRNQQKAAEIDAKINGINLWVLLGAISVISWQLTAQASMVWENSEFAMRSMMLAVIFHLFSGIVRDAASDRDELRFSRDPVAHIEEPYLHGIYGLTLILPPIYIVRLVDHKIFYVLVILFGLIPMGLGIVAMVKSTFSSVKEKKFPLPQLAVSRGGAAWMGIAMAVICVLLLVDQIDYFFFRSGAGRVDLRQMGLLAAVYFLLILCIERRFFSRSIAWTYRLETDIIVGAVDPEDAIKQIESRRLGSRLQDVIDKFFFDLERKLENFDEIFAKCEEKMAEVHQIPKEFSIERTSRAQIALQELRQHVSQIEQDYEDFSLYLEKLESKNIGQVKARLQPVVDRLKVRLRSYRPKIDDMNAVLRRVQQE